MTRGYVEGSDDDVKRNISSILEEYRQLAERMEAELDRTDRNVVLTNLAAQSAVQLLRIRRGYDGPTEILAWATRNLFELNLLLRFVLESEQNLRHFMGQRASDEIEILKGLIELGESQSSEDVRVLRARIEEIQKIVDRYGIKAERHLTTRYLAERAGVLQPYDALFKLYSKYVHPSSWLVNSSRERLDEFKDVFVAEAQRYALDTLARITDVTRST